jgi:hypothetical protein
MRMDPVARAKGLFAQGNRRAALAILKTMAYGDANPSGARLALAEMYRAMGCPDQAGRWESFSRDGRAIWRSIGWRVS